MRHKQRPYHFSHCRMQRNQSHVKAGTNKWLPCGGQHKEARAVNMGSMDRRPCSWPVFAGVENVNREYSCHFRHQCWRPVNMGSVDRHLNTALIHGPWTQVSFLDTPVHGSCSRAMNTGSVYLPLRWFVIMILLRPHSLILTWYKQLIFTVLPAHWLVKHSTEVLPCAPSSST